MLALCPMCQSSTKHLRVRHEIEKKMKAVRLKKRPTGLPQPGVDLVLDTNVPKPQASDLKDGQVLIRNMFLSLDPAMRGWMRDQKSYLPPVQLGAIMRGSSLGVIQASKHDRFHVGEWVNCGLEIGWCEFGIAEGEKLRKIFPIEPFPIRIHLSVLGGTGLTAYFGLLDIGKPKRGETVVVSAAAGATGSIVCQIAKHVVGCRVVGIAGGREKCDWLVNTLGIDCAIDYKTGEKQFKTQLRNACPKGVDVFFDNVGGWILNDVLKSLSFKARVVLCGAISGYNEEQLPPGPSAYLNLISTSSRMEGFILLNYQDKYEQAYEDLTRWLRQGKIQYLDQVIPGLENAAQALLMLFGHQGGNKGRLVIDIAHHETNSHL